MEKIFKYFKSFVAVLKGGHVFVNAFAIERRDYVSSSGIWMALVTFHPIKSSDSEPYVTSKVRSQKITQFPLWLQGHLLWSDYPKVTLLEKPHVDTPMDSPR